MAAKTKKGSTFDIMDIDYQKQFCNFVPRNEKGRIPGYLGVSSALRQLTCDDTQQVVIRSIPSAVMGRLIRAHFDILELCVSRSSSRLLTLYLYFQSCCKNIVFSFDVTIISAFSFHYFDLKSS